MELLLDQSKTYAIALEGGGAKGAYEIGVWQALNEAGIRFNAVSGTSVGALNGALMAMGDLNKAVSVWSDIRLTDVMALDTEEETGLAKLFQGRAGFGDVQQLLPQVTGVIKRRGLDIAPLRAWIREAADPERIRQSPVSLFVTTVSLTERKCLELKLNDLPDEEIWDMLLASAYHPTFRQEPLGGKYYADGGFFDAVPIHVLVENGYRDIIAVHMNGYGRERHFRLPDGVSVTHIRSCAELGGALNFDAAHSRRNMARGYFDTQRVLYGLSGRGYYVVRSLTDRFALDWLLRRELEAGETNLRTILERKLPQLAKRLDCREGDYYELMLAALEHLATEKALEPLKIYSDADLLRLVEAD